MAYPLAERPERQQPRPKSPYDDKPLGTQFADEAEKALQWATSLPVVRPVLQTVGGALRVVYENVAEPLKYESEELLAGREANVGSAILGSGIRAFEAGVKTGEKVGATVAEKFNVDPRIGSFLGGTGAETLMTLGTGTVAKKAVKVIDTLIPPGAGGLTPALAGVGGGLKLDFNTPRAEVLAAPQVMKATTSPEFTGPGMGQNVAQDPKYAGTVESYMKNVPTYSDAAAEIERRFAAGEITASRRKNALSKLKKKADAELSTFAYDPENPPVYAESSRTKAAREAQMPDPIAELITEQPAKAHQHHYLAKAQTRPFVDKMLELVNNNVADLDDLVNFFTWPEQYKLYPGNVRSNMADLSPRAHVPSEAVTDFDRKFNVHRMLQDVGLEVKSGKKGGATEFITKNYGLEKVKNADDLMRSWDQFLQEIGVPGKESAKTIQEFFLTEYRKQLTGDKLKQFNEMAAKLYK